MIWFLVTFVSAGFFALVLTHQTRKVAARFGIVDVPDGARRLHEGPIPRGAGVAIFLSVLAAVALWVAFRPDVLATNAQSGASLATLTLGGLAILVLGLIDDVRDLRARTKFLAQIGIAIGLFAAGVRIDLLAVPGAGGVEFGSVLSLAITTLWIVGLTNAFNLIDGSDGVAAGAALFASLTMAFVALLTGNVLGLIIALAIAGATCGFLFFNFPPASIFLGDSGSLLLGYLMAALGILSTQKAPTMLAVAIPVVSCGLPILDLLLTVTRRFLRREAIFGSDRGHIHHRLRDLGHSPRSVALILYASSAAFALLSLLLVQPSRGTTALVFLLAGGVAWVAVQRLHIPELLEVQRIVHRGFYQRQVIAHNVRLREAARMLDCAQTHEEVRAALLFGFSRGEFERVEVWHMAGGVRIADAENGPRPESGSWSWEFIRNGAQGGKDHQDTAIAAPQAVWLRNGNSHGARQPSANGTAHAPSGREPADLEPPLFEVCLPFRGSEGEPLGKVSLWCEAAVHHLFTDLRVVSCELQPALRRALERMKPALDTVAPTAPTPQATASVANHGRRFDVRAVP